MASMSPQWSLHTVPQRGTPFTSTCTSTTPSSWLRPPAKRTYKSQRCSKGEARIAGWETDLATTATRLLWYELS